MSTCALAPSLLFLHPRSLTRSLFFSFLITLPSFIFISQSCVIVPIDNCRRIGIPYSPSLIVLLLYHCHHPNSNEFYTCTDLPAFLRCISYYLIPDTLPRLIFIYFPRLLSAAALAPWSLLSSLRSPSTCALQSTNKRCSPRRYRASL